MMARVLKPKGVNPPQENIPKLQTVEDTLLYAVWVQGMKYENMVYRRRLFHYVQTHIEPKAGDDLQRAIERSSFFTKEEEKNGLWILYAYKSYSDLQKGINFTVINGCMTRYTAILPNLINIEVDGKIKPVQQETSDRSYYDLSNGQLYYLGIGIIPTF